MTKAINFFDAAGSRRNVRELYFYDAVGNRRTVKAAYFYDSLRGSRQFFTNGDSGANEVSFTAGVIGATPGGGISDFGIGARTNTAGAFYPYASGNLSSPPDISPVILPSAQTILVADAGPGFFIDPAGGCQFGMGDVRPGLDYAGNVFSVPFSEAGCMILCLRITDASPTPTRVGLFDTFDFMDGAGPRKASDSFFWIGYDEDSESYAVWWWPPIISRLRSTVGGYTAGQVYSGMHATGSGVTPYSWGWRQGGAAVSKTTAIEGYGDLVCAGSLYAPVGSTYHPGGNGELVLLNGTAPDIGLQGMHAVTGNGVVNARMAIFTNETAAWQKLPLTPQVYCYNTSNANDAQIPVHVESLGAWAGGWAYIIGPVTGWACGAQIPGRNTMLFS